MDLKPYIKAIILYNFYARLIEVSRVISVRLNRLG